MAGGPMVGNGGGVGANAPKNTFAGIIMVSPLPHLFLHTRLLTLISLHSGMYNVFATFSVVLDGCIVLLQHSVVSSTGASSF